MPLQRLRRLPAFQTAMTTVSLMKMKDQIAVMSPRFRSLAQQRFRQFDTPNTRGVRCACHLQNIPGFHTNVKAFCQWSAETVSPAGGAAGAPVSWMALWPSVVSVRLVEMPH